MFHMTGYDLKIDLLCKVFREQLQSNMKNGDKEIGGLRYTDNNEK